MKLFKLLLYLLFSTDLYFTPLDKMTTRTIDVVFEDSRGFIWFEGKGGISRYDGTEVKLFRAYSTGTTSLSGSIVA